MALNFKPTLIQSDLLEKLNNMWWNRLDFIQKYKSLAKKQNKRHGILKVGRLLWAELLVHSRSWEHISHEASMTSQFRLSIQVQRLLTRKSFLHSCSMCARPWVAARFSFRSLWSGFPSVGFLFITLRQRHGETTARFTKASIIQLNPPLPGRCLTSAQMFT